MHIYLYFSFSISHQISWNLHGPFHIERNLPFEITLCGPGWFQITKARLTVWMQRFYTTLPFLCFFYNGAVTVTAAFAIRSLCGTAISHFSLLAARSLARSHKAPSSVSPFGIYALRAPQWRSTFASLYSAPRCPSQQLDFKRSVEYRITSIKVIRSFLESLEPDSLS